MNGCGGMLDSRRNAPTLNRRGSLFCGGFCRTDWSGITAAQPARDLGFPATVDSLNCRLVNG
jgi:hypothetical protein